MWVDGHPTLCSVQESPRATDVQRNYRRPEKQCLTDRPWGRIVHRREKHGVGAVHLLENLRSRSRAMQDDAIFESETRNEALARTSRGPVPIDVQRPGFGRGMRDC